MTAARPPAKTFRDLVVWQKAHQFVLLVYKYSEAFPRSETYGLCSQLRRAAVSIPANIAEGFKRKGNPDKVRMLNIAQGSRPSDALMSQLEEVSRILDAYGKAILTPDS